MDEDLEKYLVWLTSKFESPTPGLIRLCRMFLIRTFERRIGFDKNRAAAGLKLRGEFLDSTGKDGVRGLPSDCSWLEMLIGLSLDLDFLYDEGVQDHFLEMIDNLGVTRVIFTEVSRFGISRFDQVDQDLVDDAIGRVDHNLIDRYGFGGLFPLKWNDHPDQREVEIWSQQAAYFSEKLEGEMWISTH